MKINKTCLVALITLFLMVPLLLFIFIYDISTYSIPTSEFNRFYVYSLTYALIGSLAAIVLSFSMRKLKKSSLPYGLALINGVLWSVDGILQLQPQMPYGFLTFVIYPVISGVQYNSLYNFLMIGYNLWIIHPYQFNALSGALQLFLGISFIFNRSEKGLKIIAYFTIAWSLIIWIFGEAFGGLFSGVPTYLTGFPGSAFIYILIAVPFISLYFNLKENLIRYFSYSMIVFFSISAIFQSIPGNGYWHNGAYANIVYSNIFNQGEPYVLYEFLNHVWPAFILFNYYLNIIFIIIPLALIILLLSKRRISFLFSAGYILPLWIIFQNMGIYVNPSTDPNSGLPLVLLFLFLYFYSNEATIDTSSLKGRIENKIS
jgi:hypothetical protein